MNWWTKPKEPDPIHLVFETKPIKGLFMLSPQVKPKVEVDMFVYGNINSKDRDCETLNKVDGKKKFHVGTNPFLVCATRQTP